MPSMRGKDTLFFIKKQEKAGDCVNWLVITFGGCDIVSDSQACLVDVFFSMHEP